LCEELYWISKYNSSSCDRSALNKFSSREIIVIHFDITKYAIASSEFKHCEPTSDWSSIKGNGHLK